jgi:hypothetical protein
VALCLFAAPAAADTEPSAAELASARSLFNEARAAEERGDWTEALTKLDAVAKVKMTPQVRFHLGLCQENTARLLEALNNLERAASEGAEQNLPTVADEAKEHAANVRARLPRLFIVVPPGTDTRVEVDGQVVASVLLSRPVAFDPGAHKIVATAPGLVFSRDVLVAEREERRIDVVLSRVSPPAAPAPASAGPVAPLASPPEASSGKGVAADSTSGNTSHDRWNTLGWVAVGVGGAALVGASASALVRQGAISDIDEACPGYRNCDRSLESSQSTARTFGALTAVLGVLGVASVATGVFIVVQPRPEPARPQVALVPWMTAGGTGATGSVSW